MVNFFCKLVDEQQFICLTVLLKRSKIEISTSNFMTKLNYGCLSQLGTPIVPVARSKTILCYTFPITAKGENA